MTDKLTDAELRGISSEANPPNDIGPGTRLLLAKACCELIELREEMAVLRATYEALLKGAKKSEAQIAELEKQLAAADAEARTHGSVIVNLFGLAHQGDYSNAEGDLVIRAGKEGVPMHECALAFLEELHKDMDTASEGAARRLKQSTELNEWTKAYSRQLTAADELAHAAAVKWELLTYDTNKALQRALRKYRVTRKESND